MIITTAFCLWQTEDDFYGEEDDDIWGPHNATVDEILRGGDEETVRRLLNIPIPSQS